MTSPRPAAVSCDHGVSLLIEPLEGWIVAPPVPPARLYLVDAEAAGPIPPGINVLVQELGGLTVEEYLTLSRLQVKALGADAVIERDESLQPPGAGHIFETVLATAAGPVRSRQLVLLHAGAAYVVTAMAPADWFAAHRARVDKALESVSLHITAGT